MWDSGHWLRIALRFISTNMATCALHPTITVSSPKTTMFTWRITAYKTSRTSIRCTRMATRYLLRNGRSTSTKQSKTERSTCRNTSLSASKTWWSIRSWVQESAWIQTTGKVLMSCLGSTFWLMRTFEYGLLRSIRIHIWACRTSICATYCQRWWMICVSWCSIPYISRDTYLKMVDKMTSRFFIGSPKHAPSKIVRSL